MLLLVVFNSNRFFSNTILNLTKIWDTWKQVQFIHCFFFYWDILEFTLFTKTMLVRQHVYLPKFCINKLFNLCLRYLLGRLWYPGVGGRKGVAPLCGLSEYVLSIKVWCSRSSQNKVWALAIRSLYELNLQHRRNYTLVKCKLCETAPKSLI